MWRLLTVGLVCALAAPVVAGSGGAGAAWHGTVAVPEPRDDPRGPRIVGVYPNPVAAEDRGEFVVLSVPPGTESGELRLADGESNVSLPAGLPSGRVAVSSHPNRTAQLTDRPVARLPDGIALANGGEKLVLWRGGQILSRIRYSDAPEGELLDATTGQWRALGATARPVVTGGPGRVRLFVLPDAPDAAVRFLREADRRILLGGYTLTSRRVTDALAGAAARGVSVRVLVDGAPVGGVPVAQRRRLDRLAAAGVEVRALAGERARYAFHHPKYAVVDDRALVTTENWKPSGIGGRGTRGWAAITAQPRVVAGLAATFRADAGWRDAVPWEEFRDRIETGDGGRPDGQFPRRFEPARVQVRGARLLVAPDNAEGATVSLIRSARESVRIEQVSIGGRRQPFLRAALDAARRGVRVRVLLSGAWYVREENRNLTAWLERRARREGLPLEAKLADPHGRFGAIHAKGVIVDGDRAVVGSLNWNNHSARENREVALVLQGEAAGRYFTRVFRADWRGGRWTVPLGVLPVCALAVVAALRRARGIEFVGRGRTSQQTPQPVSRHSVEGSGERQPEHHLYAGEQDHYSPVQGEEEALARQQRSEEDG